jgi:hypothetical protein
MAFEIKILKNNTLYLSYKGKVTKEEVYAARINAVSMIQANGLNKMLVDLTKASPEIATVDVFNIAASNKRTYKGIEKTAIYFKPGRFAKDEISLYMTTSISRGWNIKTFDDRQHAQEWLWEEEK